MFCLSSFSPQCPYHIFHNMPAQETLVVMYFIIDFHWCFIDYNFLYWKDNRNWMKIIPLAPNVLFAFWNPVKELSEDLPQSGQSCFYFTDTVYI